MSYVSLYRKYRPQTFDEILGQDHVSTTLANAVSEGRVSHAYLFTGPRGTGKTSTARILAKALNCEQGPTPRPCGKCAACIAIAEGSSLDVIEMDAASHSKVEETREILAGVPLATAGGFRKVYVIDEVHMLSPSAFNALLKTLEEPPEHVVFVLATTEPHKVLATIISRTQRFDFRRVPADVLEQHLSHVAKAEGLELPQEAIAAIARHADGGVRDALSVLDQLTSWSGAIELRDIERLLGSEPDEQLTALFDAVSSGELAEIFRLLEAAVERGADVRQLAMSILGRARELLFIKTAPDQDALLESPPESLPALRVQAESFSVNSLVRLLELVAKAVTDMRNVSNQRLLLEIALVRCASPDADSSVEGLVARLERLERRIGIAAPAGEETGPPGAATVPVADAPARPAGRRAGPTRAAPARPAVPEKSVSPASKPAAPEDAVGEAPIAESPPEPETHVPAVVGLSSIRDSWSVVVQDVNKRSRRIAAFLNPSRAVTLDGTELTVEVQSDFHVAAMKDASSAEVLESAVYNTLGIKPRVTFVAKGRAGDSEEAVAATSEEPAGEAPDPIELLRQGLGAEVVEDRSGDKGDGR